MAAEEAAPEAQEAPEAAEAAEAAESESPEAAAAETPEAGDGEAGEGEDPEPSAEPDWKARSRHWESRAKANKARADEKDAEIASLKAQLARQGAVSDAAREKGVDAGILARMAGDTPEEIAENADALLAWARQSQGYPEAPDDGAGRPAAVSREAILAERNPVVRARLMGEHKELFVK